MKTNNGIRIDAKEHKLRRAASKMMPPFWLEVKKMTDGAFVQRIGGRNYVVSAFGAEKARETLEEKLKKLLQKEVVQMAKTLEK